MPSLQTILDDLVGAAAPDRNGPGAAAGIMVDGVVTAVTTRGMANLEHRVPWARSTVSHAASVSKMFVGFVTMVLVEQSCLELDDHVIRHLPWFPFEEITVRQLIHHTSGLRDQWDLVVLSGRFMEDVISRDDVVRLVTAQRELNFPPGTQYLYCNTGYTLLGLIIETLTGQALQDFCATQIFEPANMRRTTFRDDMHTVIADRADSYSKNRRGSWTRETLSYSIAGATGLNTTLDDLGRWAMLAMSDIGRRRLETRGVLACGREIGYAVGVEIADRHGHTIVQHSGSDAGYRAHLFMAPQLGIATFALANSGSISATNIVERAFDAAIGRSDDSSAQSVQSWQPSTATLISLHGRYVEERVDRVHELAAVADGGIGVRLGSVDPVDDLLPLSPASPGHLAQRERGIDIDVRDPTGPLVRMLGSEPVRLHRVEPVTTTTSAPRPGTYYSRELDVLVHVEAGDDGLYLRRSTWGRQRLLPTAPDLYQVRVPDARRPYPVSVRFDPTLDALCFTTGRAWRVRFLRMSHDPSKPSG